MSGVIVGLVIGLAGIGLWMRWWMRNAFAASPKRVLHRLQKSNRVHMHLRGTDGIWNPSKPLGVDNRIFGPGEATYWQDETGTVHLDLRGRDGQLQRIEGPVPDVLLHPTPAALRIRKLLRAVLAGYVVVCLAGLLTGAVVAGNTAVDRLVGAFVGLLVAMALVTIGATAVRVAFSIRSLAQKGKPDPSPHHDPS